LLGLLALISWKWRPKIELLDAGLFPKAKRTSLESGRVGYSEPCLGTNRLFWRCPKCAKQERSISMDTTTLLIVILLILILFGGGYYGRGRRWW